jgi:hypothetical protein
VTKFAVHLALKSIASRKLTFDEKVELHRVGCQKGTYLWHRTLAPPQLHSPTMSEAGLKVKADDCAAPLRTEIKESVLKLKEVPPFRTPPVTRPEDPRGGQDLGRASEGARGECWAV